MKIENAIGNGKVYSFMGSNPTKATNYSSAMANASSQTPGSGNNADNIAFLLSLCKDHQKKVGKAKSLGGNEGLIEVKSQDNTIRATIYPNPVTAFLYMNINSSEERIATITLLDFTGKRVLQYPVELSLGNNQYEINIQNIEHIHSGMYFMQVVSDDEVLLSKKIACIK